MTPANILKIVKVAISWSFRASEGASNTGSDPGFERDDLLVVASFPHDTYQFWVEEISK